MSPIAFHKGNAYLLKNLISISWEVWIWNIVVEIITKGRQFLLRVQYAFQFGDYSLWYPINGINYLQSSYATESSNSHTGAKQELQKTTTLEWKECILSTEKHC